MTRDLTGLGRHLERAYGVTVERMTPLEPWAPDGVQRVDLEGGDSWVMRVHGPARPVAEVHGDADLLRFLEQHDFPAERLAHPEPVTTYGSMSAIVTKLLPGTNCRNDGSPSTINGVGRLLAGSTPSRRPRERSAVLQGVGTTSHREAAAATRTSASCCRSSPPHRGGCPTRSTPPRRSWSGSSRRSIWPSTCRTA